ncbi:hypothetical protein GALMADRAFT_254739 [Galerina marginata CBS 339.88]|uniref:Elongation factor methyltransferase 7 n=1 Tax=Galerina marginata (strain CBS 339.88) TaxID=685588 RepID=A0A067SVA2_GALM3|nr:hypothetical protein GALMADRAFT_254739 [Galerina marginata CBS 339.88]
MITSTWKAYSQPPTPEPTFSTYIREEKGDDWKDIKIRLVGSHPLWAHYLWNAALALASYLDANPDTYKDRFVLELGAGGGLPSIVTAKNGAQKVVVTDYPDASLVDNIDYNVSSNLDEGEVGHVDVQGYIWGRPVDPLLNGLPPSANPKKFHLIILSDLIFNHSQHDALLKTCELSLAIAGPESPEIEPHVLVFYTHHRPHLAHRDMEFFSTAKDRGWVCEEIVTRMFPAMFPEDPGEESIRSTVHGWKLKRRI